MTHRSWTPEVIEGLAGHFEPWLSCDGCFDVADRMVGLLLDGGQLPEEFRAHLRGCPACRAEAETLAELAAADEGIDPALAVARLEAQLAE
jgi:hypothetical protein